MWKCQWIYNSKAVRCKLTTFQNNLGSSLSKLVFTIQVYGSLPCLDLSRFLRTPVSDLLMLRLEKVTKPFLNSSSLRWGRFVWRNSSNLLYRIDHQSAATFGWSYYWLKGSHQLLKQRFTYIFQPIYLLLNNSAQYVNAKKKIGSLYLVLGLRWRSDHISDQIDSEIHKKKGLQTF